MDINIMDAGDPGLYNRWDKYSRNSTDVNITVGGMCNGVVGVMGLITHRAPLGGMDKLTVYGHGADGIQIVAGGRNSVGVTELSAFSAKSSGIKSPAKA